MSHSCLYFPAAEQVENVYQRETGLPMFTWKIAIKIEVVVMIMVWTQHSCENLMSWYQTNCIPLYCSALTLLVCTCFTVQNCRVYTTMLGKKSSMATLKEALRMKGVRVTYFHLLITCFYICQNGYVFASVCKFCFWRVANFTEIVELYLFIVCGGLCCHSCLLH